MKACGKKVKILQLGSTFMVQAVSPYTEFSKSFTCEIKLDPNCLIIYVNQKGILFRNL